MTTRFHVLIPARLASTRLPDKPLADIAGLPMVVRVARRMAAAQAASVVVAADSPRIAQACAQHQVQCVLTRTDHASGSDRLAEACEALGLEGNDIVVNVQGDEPLLEPELVREVAALLAMKPDCVMSTLAHPLAQAADFANPNIVKVVLDAQHRALYFSRASIPCWRDGQSPATAASTLPALRHVGLYAYRAGFLRQFPKLSSPPLEQVEALEQLRVLWHGHRIAVHVSPTASGIGVDTPEDLARVREIILANPSA
jgi:3-deoxy-manno-octulosonate cytidylyltransferase (CMP-KDO synthetase)